MRNFSDLAHSQGQGIGWLTQQFPFLWNGRRAEMSNRHAPETLGCIRVQLKTDLRNKRSQKAIERIGRVKEGILRNHVILPDGPMRPSAFYSILDTEWPEAKKRLEEMMQR